jgi:uncharacterized membrane protein
MFERATRLVKHRWMEDARHLIDQDLLRRLKQRVSLSESAHTGEVRICIESALPNSYLLRPGAMRVIARQRALSQFGKLHVWDTEHNNGVLIYLLLAERTIELVADRGLNHVVKQTDWQTMVQSLGEALRDNRLEDGLNQAIDAVTAVLIQHFPLEAGTIRPNELPDQPTLS